MLEVKGTEANPPEATPKPPDLTKVHRLEAAGLIIIAAVILVIVLFRYWSYISWSAR